MIGAARGKILDGRNRYLAARKVGIEPVFAAWEREDNPWEFAWQENATRRQLDPGVKAACRRKQQRGSAEWEDQIQARRAAANAKRSEAAKEQHEVSRPWAGEKVDGPVSRDTRPSEQPEPDRLRTQEARAAGVSEATMARALSLEATRPDLLDRVALNEISLNEGLRLKRRDEVAKNLSALPSDKFRVLYADPPWSYGDKREEIGEGLAYGPATGHYPAMPMAELTVLDVASIAADDAVLFLWVTSPLLPEGVALMKAWGFDYKASFVWNKVRHNYGHYNSVRHEFLLIGTRGSCLPDKETLDPSVVTIERPVEHSAKPSQFRDLIDSMYPRGRRLELFARGAMSGEWEAWGACLILR